jgi:hypothetical protein
MYQHKVSFLSVKDTIDFTKGITDSYSDSYKKFIGLGIYSEHSAYLLNQLIDYKWNTLMKDPAHPVHSCMLIHCGCNVGITNFGEVGLIFRFYNKIGKFFKVYDSAETRIASIKCKIASELKSFWDDMTQNGETSIMIEGINDDDETWNDAINSDEYQVLYETLRGKNVNKIQKKYGVNTYNKMIGHKLENQLVFNAISTIQTEILKLVEDKNIESQRLTEEFNKKFNELFDKRDKDLMNLDMIFNQKIDELEKQSKMLLKNHQINEALV